MINPGDYTLFAGAITAPLTRSTGIQMPVTGLEGMLASSFFVNFKYGSGGMTCSFIAQTSPDLGTTWIDRARADFLLASRIYETNLEGLLSLGPRTYADLSSEGVLDGVLCSQWRGLLIVTGTYVNTTLLATMHPR